MNIKRYFAPTAREALRRVKEELGADAIVLSNRSVDDGVEITAVLASEIPDEFMAASPATLPRVDREEDFTVSLSAGKRKPVASRPAAAEKQQTVREWQPAPARTQPDAPKRDAAQRQAAVAASDDSRLLRELAGIKGLIERQLAGFAWTGLGHEAPAKTLLLTDLLDAGFSAQLARRLVGSLPAGATCEEGRDWLKGVLSRNLQTVGTEDEIVDTGGVYALVGPTGVGKTTTTAKLAARSVVRHGADSVALLTTDSYRIGAHEQLRIYGRILGVQVHAVRDAADLRRTLADLSGKHMVLIDTIGMSQRDRLVADMMKKMGRMGKGGMLRQAMKGMMGKGGMPDPARMSPDEMAAMAKGMQEGMGGGLPGGRGGLGGLNLPGGLSGLGGFGKKK